MKVLKKYLQSIMKKKVDLALNTGAVQDRKAVNSPYILGVWFYEPKMPEKG